jgi:hypothetical protein
MATLLNGRMVELRLVGIGTGLAAMAVHGEDRRRAVNMILVDSAHWKDTGERVFDSVEAIDRWPMPDLLRVMRLGNEAWELNQPIDDEPVDKPNGSAAPQPELPSPSP